MEANTGFQRQSKPAPAGHLDVGHRCGRSTNNDRSIRMKPSAVSLAWTNALSESRLKYFGPAGAQRLRNCRRLRYSRSISDRAGTVAAARSQNQKRGKPVRTRVSQGAATDPPSPSIHGRVDHAHARLPDRTDPRPLAYQVVDGAFGEGCIRVIGTLRHHDAHRMGIPAPRRAIDRSRTYRKLHIHEHDVWVELTGLRREPTGRTLPRRPRVHHRCARRGVSGSGGCALAHQRSVLSRRFSVGRH